jgi:DNA-binding response OmpR family regulator
MLAAVRTHLQLRVLVVDDDPALVESMRTALEDEGHKVTTAAGGQAGIDAFRLALRVGRPYDIVITDWRMPYVDGAQVASQVRAASPATPIVLLTGWGRQVGCDPNRMPDFDWLLGKPPRIRELRLALQELTRPRASARAG